MFIITARAAEAVRVSTSPESVRVDLLSALGFRVWGLGFGVQDLGFRD